MKKILFIFFMSLSLQSAAATRMELWKSSIDANLFGETSSIPIDLSAMVPDNANTQLRISAEAIVTNLLPIASRALERIAAANHRGCRERWSAWDGRVSATGSPHRNGALNAQVTIRVEIWLCKSPLKTRLGRETATVNAKVRPVVRDGRLQLKLVGFDIRGLGEISRVLGVKKKVRRALRDKIAELNGDPGFHSPVPELVEAGYSFENIGVGIVDGKDSVLVARIAGPNDSGSLLNLMSSLIKRLGK